MKKPLGDFGPITRQQLVGARVDPIPGDANNMHRKRRVDWLEKYHLGERGNGKREWRIAPFLSLRQHQAGQEIRDAYEGTLKSPKRTGEKVDGSPKPDANIAV